MEILLFPLIGIVAGLSAGLLGIGGGIVVVPSLVLLDFSPAHAIGTSVFVVFGNAIIGTAQHARLGNVDLRMGPGLAAGALPGAIVGAYALAQFQESAVRLAFIFLLVILAFSMARRPRQNQKTEKTERFRTTRFWPKPAVGCGAGILAGLFGVGGGLLMVPAQTLLFGTTIHRAIGTSLSVIALTGVVALASHVILGTAISFNVGALIIGGGLIGAPLGAVIASRLPERPLQLAFAMVLLTFAAGMLLR